MVIDASMAKSSPSMAIGASDSLIYEDGQYLAHNQSWHVEDSPWKAAQIKALLDRNKIACRTMCEVGCGAGEILRQLSLTSPDTKFTGYEISPQAFDLSKSRRSEKLDFVCRDLLEEDVHFDGLLCIDVFEHVSDYMGFIRGLKAKSTYKVFHIPLSLTVHNLLSPQRLINERTTWGHLHYYSRETALAVLQDCGYEILDSTYTPHFRDLPAASTIGRMVRLPLRFLYWAMPHLFVRTLGGCSLLVLAK
jgi:Methyltransferase domain